MPCVPPTQTGHREKHDVATNHFGMPLRIMSGDAHAHNMGTDEEDQYGEETISDRVRSSMLGVTKLLSFQETRNNPKAIEAVRNEVAALAECGTWEDFAYEKDDLIAWAKRTGTTIHVGEGLGICSIKNSEMPEDMQKWKGRFCYRAPTVRDEGGALAIFQ